MPELDWTVRTSFLAIHVAQNDYLPACITGTANDKTIASKHAPTDLKLGR
jgi:hypothetical protein